MKYFAVVLLLVVAAVNADDWTVKTVNDLISARNTCATRLNVPADNLVEYRKWNFQDTTLTKAYVTCIFKEFGLFCEHEGFHLDRLVLQLQNDQTALDVRTLVENCTTRTEADVTSEDWVFRSLKCFIAEHLSLVKSKLTKA